MSHDGEAGLPDPPGQGVPAPSSAGSDEHMSTQTLQGPAQQGQDPQPQGLRDDAPQAEAPGVLASGAQASRDQPSRDQAPRVQGCEKTAAGHTGCAWCRDGKRRRFDDDSAPAGIDKSALTIAEPRRRRDKDHLRFVATQACLVCGRKPSDPHHLRFAQPRAMSRKVSDEFTVPLCRLHHRAVHHSANEARWWREAGVDPLKVALTLWRRRGLRARRGKAEPASTV